MSPADWQISSPSLKNPPFASPTELSCYVALSGVRSRSALERQRAVLPVPGAAKCSSPPCPDPLPGEIRLLRAARSLRPYRHPARLVPASSPDRTGYRSTSDHLFRSSSRFAGRRRLQLRQLGPHRSYLRPRPLRQEFLHPATVLNISSRPKGAFLSTPRKLPRKQFLKITSRSVPQNSQTKHMLSSH